MDFDEHTSGPLLKAFQSGYNVTFAGNNLGSSNNVCTFIEGGALAIGWDGNVSPCPPLVHTHTGYLRGYERVSHQHIVGNVRERGLLDMWHDPEYVAYRERVQRFAFAPCTACGGCLWAQGVTQCP